jgi:hypothetical protein
MASLNDIDVALGTARDALREAMNNNANDPHLRAIKNSVREAQRAVGQLDLQNVEAEIRDEADQYKKLLSNLALIGGGNEGEQASQALKLLSDRLIQLNVEPGSVDKMKADMAELSNVIQNRADLADSVTRVVGTVVKVAKIASVVV